MLFYFSPVAFIYSLQAGRLQADHLIFQLRFVWFSPFALFTSFRASTKSLNFSHSPSFLSGSSCQLLVSQQCKCSRDSVQCYNLQHLFYSHHLTQCMYYLEVGKYSKMKSWVEFVSLNCISLIVMLLNSQLSLSLMNLNTFQNTLSHFSSYQEN